jgi:hypothetical protein
LLSSVTTGTLFSIIRLCAQIPEVWAAGSHTE